MNIQSYVQQQVEAVCPIVGISFGKISDRATWEIDFSPAATSQQKAAAQSVLASIDPTAIPASQDELDVIAAKAYPKLAALKGMSPAQVQAYVAGRYSLPAANLAAANTQLTLLLDDVMTLAIAVSVLSRKL